MIDPVTAVLAEVAEEAEAVAEVSESVGEASETLSQEVLDTPLESLGQEGGNVLEKEKVLEGKDVVEPSKTLPQDVLDKPLESFGEESEKSLVQNETEQYNPIEDVKNEVDYAENNEDGGPKKIKTINDGYEGKCHPDTGVPYVEKEVVRDNGERVKGVFPQFESKFDAQLPEDMYKASDAKQEAECNKQLKGKVSEDPDLRSKFTKEQLEDIEDGVTPEGHTWHHNEETGKMQLVESDTHNQTRHTGGRFIWGGGTDNR